MGLLTTRPLSVNRRLSDPGWLLRAGIAAALFVVVFSAAWVVAPERRGAILLGLGMSILLFASMALPWWRWPDSWQLYPALGGFLPVACLDYAAGMYYLAVAPIIWIALFFTRRMLLIGLGGYLVTLLLPRSIQPEAYPTPDLLTLTVLSGLLIVAALATQSLAANARSAINEARTAAAQARSDRDMVNAYLENAGALVVVLDPEGNVLLFNRFMEEATGVSTKDVVGHVTWDPTDAEDAARQSFERVMAGESPVTVESDLPTINGEILRIAWTNTVVTDQTGQVSRVISIGLDVTAQRAADAAMVQALEREKQAAERLRELDRAKSDFVATVSHDLRTPLTSIVGNTEMLLDGDAGELSAVQRRLMATIKRNASRLDVLVGDLLLLSRLESGTMRLNLRPVSLGEIIDGALEALAAKLSADVTMAVNRPPRPVLVNADRDQLERVTTNLLSNAIKFTPPGGKISLDVDANSKHVKLRVADTGIGIPEEELPFVFDRFFRSSRSQSKKSAGSGLGLTIAKSIVELHHGSIEAAANSEGGTVFTVTLPRIATAVAERREEYA